jgi:tRNA-dihydrouridine synthase
MATFWRDLADKTKLENRAFTVLAPMEDVTDTVFRQIVLEEGRPDLFFTEFTNCDGLNSRGRDRIIHRFRYSPAQQPIIAQVWGRKPETYIATVPLLVELGFKGVDVNMGCPVPKVIKSGAGGGLIREPMLAQEILQAMKEAVAKYPGFGFSLKTRIGFNSIDFDWVELVLKEQLDAITFHFRTVKEMSKVPAHWELAQKIVQLKDEISPRTVIIGNGDITTKEQLRTYGSEYGVDGLMVGRGIFSNLWLFSQNKDDSTVEKKERLQVLQRHITLFHEEWTGNKNFELLKKFFKVYIKNFEGAHQLKDQLQRLKIYEEMNEVLLNEIG